MNFRKILSSTMILIFIAMSLRHAWTVFFNLGPEALEFMASANISHGEVKAMVGAGIIASLMLLFPKTFMAGNIVNIVITTYIGYLLYTSGRTSGALIEIPFIASYLLLMYLGHPLVQKNFGKIT